MEKAVKMVDFPIKDANISGDKWATYGRAYLRYMAKCLSKQITPLDFYKWLEEIWKRHDERNPPPPKRRVEIIDATKVKEEEATPLRVKSKRWFRK